MGAEGSDALCDLIPPENNIWAKYCDYSACGCTEQIRARQTTPPLHKTGAGNIYQAIVIRIKPTTIEISRAIKPTNMKRARPLLSRFKR